MDVAPIQSHRHGPVPLDRSVATAGLGADPSEILEDSWIETFDIPTRGWADF